MIDKEARKLTTGDSYHASASMDARGTRLVFLIGRLPSRNVSIREIATGREAAVAADSADKCAAVISPDGSKVAWSVCGPGKEPVFMATVNSDLSVSVPEKVCEDCGHVADWSRTGDSIVFVDHSSPARVGILNLSSGARTMIGSSQYSLDTPRLSPDGSWMAVTAVHQRDARAQIFAIPLEGGKPAPEEAWVAITDGESWDDKPVWTARGDALLYYSRRDGFGCIWRQADKPIHQKARGRAERSAAFSQHPPLHERTGFVSGFVVTGGGSASVQRARIDGQHLGAGRRPAEQRGSASPLKRVEIPEPPLVDTRGSVKSMFYCAAAVFIQAVSSQPAPQIYKGFCSCRKDGDRV